jgi:hypothetical protein
VNLVPAALLKMAAEDTSIVAAVPGRHHSQMHMRRAAVMACAKATVSLTTASSILIVQLVDMTMLYVQIIAVRRVQADALWQRKRRWFCGAAYASPQDSDK